MGQETCATRDRADADAGNAGAAPGCVEQLVILTIVERLFEGGAFEEGDLVDGGGDFRCDAETVQVEREAVADVDAGGRFASQFPAFLKARYHSRPVPETA